MDAPSKPDALRSLKRISDPTRARILRLLLDAPDGRGSVTRLAETLGLRQPTVSHHLKLLRDEGLVERAQEGRTAWYSITTDQLDRVAELVRDDRPADDATALDRIVEDLATRYRGALARESIEQYVRDSYDRLQGRKNRASLTGAFAVSRLDALLRATGERAAVPEVLFVCVQNAGRSQLASAILRQLAGDRVVVRTAGSEPADAVRSTIVTVLDEVGTPLGGEFPKPLTDEAVRAADYVITMGCGDACPIYPGREYLDWDVPDPVGQPLATVREIRDDIEDRVRDLLNRIDAERLVNTANAG
ncbi:metalloregulator ArsR/SmtB family transcription factor [Leifsonia shinshuensis]|uniref:metalloregulator ArsR/SmtB family transcription factor n=1 Tax=Leifsonia shinshuensis TaxID=150026 RepID=UPI001F50F322|nr:metalloregulator ArsR/SmtB family transcription factor [Leifsonia shinshuensis]MCI0157102.1 metalloregulator ArsR/SmtB family transcription factor [Leifsonia shinshuensis]